MIRKNKNDHVHDRAPSTRGGNVGVCARLYKDAECVMLHEVSEHAEGKRMQQASGVNVVSVKRFDMSSAADDIVVAFLNTFYKKLADCTLSEAYDVCEANSQRSCEDKFPGLSGSDDIFHLWPGKGRVVLQYAAASAASFRRCASRLAGSSKSCKRLEL